MVEKALSSQSYGKLTDRYAHDALDQLTSYVGYDGYQQQFTYDANGMRLSKKETGDTSRSTLEELLRGNIAGLPEIVVPQAQDDAADVPEELAWATTDYLYDITQEYYQVISETRTETNGHTATTAYAYGLERIAAYTADSKTSYVYDGRGSVAQAVTAPVAGEKVSSALPDVTVKVQSFSYTAFGEQMSTQKVSGFAYNAEAYDAVTDMINLRARQYEPTIGRFEQKDVIHGQVRSSKSFNRYIYCFNNPFAFMDPSGMKSTTVKKRVDGVLGRTVGKIKKSINSTLSNVKQAIKALSSAANKGYDASKNSSDENVREAYNIATSNIEKSRLAGKKLSVNEKNKIFASACMAASIKLAEKYGINKARVFTKEETLSVYYSMIAMNPNTSKTDRKSANRILLDNGYSEAKFDKKMVCVPYVCNAYQNTALYEILKKIPKYKQVVRKTTPLYAALAGGESREYGNITGTNIPNEYVKAVISVGNANESLKIKLAGDSEYMVLYDSSIIQFTTKEQMDILLGTDVTQPLDIMFFGKNNYKKNGETINSGDKEYNPDINQIHVVLFDSSSTYSGMGMESGSGESNVQQNKEINAEKKFGIDVILMNHNSVELQKIIDLLKGE